MPHPLSINLQQKNVQTLKQMQCIIMSPQMQQAIHLLEAPLMELVPLIELEMEQNPILEYSEEECQEERDEEPAEHQEPPEKELSFDDRDLAVLRQLDEDFHDHFWQNEQQKSQYSSDEEKLQTFLESSIVEIPKLFNHLMLQAHDAFSTDKEIALAELIIGNLNEFGFLTTPLEEIALLEGCSIEVLKNVLATVKTFTPAGVGASNLNESLLIQLKAYGKQKTLAYQIIDKHFDDLLHNRISNIKKGLNCTTEEVGEMIKHIAKLDLHPGTQLSTTEAPIAFPDVVLKQEEETFKAIVNEDSIPRLRINSRYLRMLQDENIDKETKDFVLQKIDSAKWLFRNLMERNNTLQRIAESLAKRHRDFFLNPQGKLAPLTMKTIAEELELHESTVARAVSNKYIDTPRGLLPLRFFFTSGLSSTSGEDVSANTVKELIKELIHAEDAHHPLSDEALSHLIQDKGIQCARRTVAKYRTILNIGNAQQRRNFQKL